MNNNKNKEDSELDDLIDQIDDPFAPDTNYDNLSTHTCDTCGARLTVQEFELNEDTCEDCMWEQTSGLSEFPDDEEIDDDE